MRKKMADLPEKITDINDEKVLVEVMKNICKCARPEDTYKIKNGFIYYIEPDLIDIGGYLVMEQVEDIQEIYEDYRQGVDYRAIKEPKSEGRYLMFNNIFNLITSDTRIRIIDNLIFCADDSLSYIAQTDTGYYHVSFHMNGLIYPYTPIKFNYKINILKKVNGERVFTFVNGTSGTFNYRHAIDSYSACNACFICADTYDIVNVETGERVKTWPLICISSLEINLENLADFENAIDNIGCVCPKIDHEHIQPRSACIFFDEQWNVYYLQIDYEEDQELRRVNSGKVTKAAIAVTLAEAE